MLQTLCGGGPLFRIIFEHPIEKIVKAYRVIMIPFVLFNENLVQIPWPKRSNVPKLTYVEDGWRVLLV